MANEYAAARTVRKGPKITMGQGMHRVEPDQNQSRIVIESPGVKDETEKKTRELTPDEVRQEEIKNRGGAYSDRIKIEPKFGMKDKPPLPSDAEMQKRASTAVTQI